jgi:hypothetical protein
MINRIILHTKEFGKIEVPDGNWANISLNGITLHSTNEPAVQEYYDKHVRCLWYYNGKHHSWLSPAIYTAHDDLVLLESQQFDVYTDYTSYFLNNQHKYTTVYYMIHGVNISYNEWFKKRMCDWRKEKIESFLNEDY